MQTVTTSPPPASADTVVLPPHSIDDEQALLGALLIDPKALYDVEDIVSRDDFYVERHRWVWDAMLRLRERGLSVDIITLSGTLGERLEEAGGQAYLTRLLSLTPTSLHASSYARRVAELSARRRLIQGAGEIARNAYNEETPFEDVLAEAERQVFDVAQKIVGGGDFQGADTLISGLLDRLGSGEPPSGLRTGFPSLDRIFRMRPGDFIVLAGRPGNGKTSMLLQMAAHAGVEEKTPTAVFSLEMPGDHIMSRLVSQATGVSLTHILNNSLAQQEWEFVAEAAGVLAESPLFVNDSARITPVQLRSQCMRLAASQGLGLVVVDYLQLIRGTGRYHNRVEEVTEISRALKALARELDVPVLAAAQLSRSVEQRQDKRPMLSDLRESGSIEQDADVVLFVYPKNGSETEKYVSVEKHRNGPTGTVEMTFTGRTVSFS